MDSLSEEVPDKAPISGSGEVARDHGRGEGFRHRVPIPLIQGSLLEALLCDHHQMDQKLGHATISEGIDVTSDLGMGSAIKDTGIRC